jgi:hypothetical protein
MANLEVVKRSLETYCRKNFYHLRNCMELEELQIPDRNAIMTRAVRNEGMTTRSRANEGESPPHVPRVRLRVCKNYSDRRV